jgi:hypothetical protein
MTRTTATAATPGEASVCSTAVQTMLHCISRYGGLESQRLFHQCTRIVGSPEYSQTMASPPSVKVQRSTHSKSSSYSSSLGSSSSEESAWRTGKYSHVRACSILGLGHCSTPSCAGHSNPALRSLPFPCAFSRCRASQAARAWHRRRPSSPQMICEVDPWVSKACPPRRHL